MVFHHSRHEQRQADLSHTKQRSTHIVGWQDTAATHKNSVDTSRMRCKKSVKLRARPVAGYRAAFGNRRVDLSGTYEIGSGQARFWIVAGLDGNDRAPPWRRNCEHPQVIRNRDAGIEMRVRSHGGELGRLVAFFAGGALQSAPLCTWTPNPAPLQAAASAGIARAFFYYFFSSFLPL
jgi:hypothetical protein